MCTERYLAQNHCGGVENISGKYRRDLQLNKTMADKSKMRFELTKQSVRRCVVEKHRCDVVYLPNGQRMTQEANRSDLQRCFLQGFLAAKEDRLKEWRDVAPRGGMVAVCV